MTSLRFVSFTTRATSSASATVLAMGFSMKTWQPCRMAWME